MKITFQLEKMSTRQEEVQKGFQNDALKSAIFRLVSMRAMVDMHGLFLFRAATPSVFHLQVLCLIHGYLLRLLLRHWLLLKIQTFKKTEPILYWWQKGGSDLELSRCLWFIVLMFLCTLLFWTCSIYFGHIFCGLEHVVLILFGMNLYMDYLFYDIIACWEIMYLSYWLAFDTHLLFVWYVVFLIFCILLYIIHLPRALEVGIPFHISIFFICIDGLHRA